jgi:hypothetical protein
MPSRLPVEINGALGTRASSKRDPDGTARVLSGFGLLDPCDSFGDGAARRPLVECVAGFLRLQQGATARP